MEENMKIITFNVNGLRAVSNKGFEQWFRELKPDVMALQEIKAFDKDVSHLIKQWSDLYEIHLNPAKKAGYSGTALFILKNSKEKIIQLKSGLDIPEFDDEGRFILAEFESFYLLSGYFPNGQADHNRVPYKLNFSNKVLELANELLQSTKKEIIITGDLNTAHHPIDLSNPQANKNSTGFLPIERKFLDQLIENNYFDVFRHFNPLKKEEYTWWTYRNNCRAKNIGWRLDYFFASKNILSKIKKIEHLKEVLGSDHCPVLLELK